MHAWEQPTAAEAMACSWVIVADGQKSTGLRFRTLLVPSVCAENPAHAHSKPSQAPRSRSQAVGVFPSPTTTRVSWVFTSSACCFLIGNSEPAGVEQLEDQQLLAVLGPAVQCTSRSPKSCEGRRGSGAKRAAPPPGVTPPQLLARLTGVRVRGLAPGIVEAQRCTGVGAASLILGDARADWGSHKLPNVCEATPALVLDGVEPGLCNGILFLRIGAPGQLKRRQAVQAASCGVHTDNGEPASGGP